ncbi:MAG: hypothetical protein ACPG05_02120, partial [Bdellovibrionales bacterium]
LKSAIESAKESAFRKGKQEGFRESEEGFSQKLLQVCQSLTQDVERLIGEEEARQNDFRRESVALVENVLEAALPDLMARGDFDATLSFLSQTLEKHAHESDVTVVVQEDYVEPLKNYFDENIVDDTRKIHFKSSDDKAEDGLYKAKVSWTHGGAVRDSEGLRADILKVLEQALAEKAFAKHNGADDQDVEEPAKQEVVEEATEEEINKPESNNE